MGARGTKPIEYNLYNDNNLIASGTVSKMAAELNITEQYLRMIRQRSYVGPYKLTERDTSKPIKKFDYALYKGDEFIVVGSIKEIAKYQNVSVNYIWKIRTRNYKGKYDLIKLED